MYHNQNFILGTQRGIAYHSKPNITWPFTPTRGNRNKRTPPLSSATTKYPQTFQLLCHWTIIIFRHNDTDDRKRTVTVSRGMPRRATRYVRLVATPVGMQNWKTNENSILCAWAYFSFHVYRNWPQLSLPPRRQSTMVTEAYISNVYQHCTITNANSLHNRPGTSMYAISQHLVLEWILSFYHLLSLRRLGLSSGTSRDYKSLILSLIPTRKECDCVTFVKTSPVSHHHHVRTNP